MANWVIKDSNKDTIWIMLALLVGSIEPIVAKYGLRGAVTPIQLFVVRNLVAAVVLSPVLFKLPKVNLRSLTKIAPASILLMMTGLCTLIALKYLTAVTVITIVTTTPAMVAVLNQRRGRDILAPKFWLGFWLAFVGVVMSLEFDSLKVNPIGLVCVFVAVFTSSFYRVQMEDLSDQLTPSVAAAASFALIGLLTAAFLLPFTGPLPQDSLPTGITIGISAAAANVAFIVALSRVGATRISIITMIQRPLLIGAAALILREQPTILQLIGIVLVVVGMNYAKVTRLPPKMQEVTTPTLTVTDKNSSA